MSVTIRLGGKDVCGCVCITVYFRLATMIISFIPYTWISSRSNDVFLLFDLHEFTSRLLNVDRIKLLEKFCIYYVCERLKEEE